MRELDSAVDLRWTGKNPAGTRLLRAIVAVQLDRLQQGAGRPGHTSLRPIPAWPMPTGLRANVHLLQEDYDLALDDANYAISSGAPRPPTAI